MMGRGTMETKLKHKADFGKKTGFYARICIILLILSVFSAVAIALFPADSPYFDNLILVMSLAILLLIAFFTVFMITRKLVSQRGRFEAADVMDNRLHYETEKGGTLVLEPGLIESIRLINTTGKNNDLYYRIEVTTAAKQKIKPSTALSDYAELVKKVREFKQSNQIQG
jgi:membrane protein YdbS with pleckstrin-like domain